MTAGIVLVPLLMLSPEKDKSLWLEQSRGEPERSRA
jgi:hypothetical protein